MRSLAQAINPHSDSTKEISFIYKNWRGETTLRVVLPLEMWYGSTEWHPRDQWFMKAIDLDKDEERNFALTDIVSFKEPLG